MLASDPECSYKERARNALREAIRQLSGLTDTAAAILPTEIYVEVRQTEQLVVDIVINIDEGKDVKNYIKKLNNQTAKTAL